MTGITVTELTFKSNLQRLRVEHGYSKYKVAKLIGLNYSYYRRMEDINVKTTPSFEVLEKIATVFDVPVKELFKADELMPEEAEKLV